jgi:hypothetical protein
MPFCFKIATKIYFFFNHREFVKYFKMKRVDKYFVAIIRHEWGALSKYTQLLPSHCTIPEVALLIPIVGLAYQ